MICYSCNSIHTCNQWEFNTSNINVPCMLTNPKDQDLAGHAMSKFHLVSSLTFLKTIRTSKKLSCSHFPRVHTQIKISHLNLLSFLLRKELGSSLESSRKPTGQHLKRKIKLYLISSSYSLKETRRIKYSLKLSTSHTFGSSH